MKNLIKWKWPLMMALLFACEKEENEPAVPNEEGTLRAVAIATPAAPLVGEVVTLDASQSEDPDNVGYNINWTFLSKPANSASVITGASGASGNFIPDQAGDYTLILKITNAQNTISDADTVSVSATAPEFIVIDQDINSDRVLDNINEPAEPKDYLVTKWIDVTARLTIMPGVRLHFAENAGFNLRGNGVLMADGEAAYPIVFTGESETNGFWRGINIFTNSVENSISNAEISYAGSQEAATYYQKAALTIDGARINLDNVSIRNSGQYGIQTRRNGSAFPMRNMSFSENEGNHLYIDASQLQYLDETSTFDNGYVEVISGRSEDDQTIAALNGANYLISGRMEFNSRVTIAEGAVFEFGPDVGLAVSGDGVIIAEGSEQEKIVFTGKSQTAGAWKGIWFTSPSVDNVMDHVEIHYAGSSDAATYFDKAALTIDNAKVNLRNMLIADTDGYGIQTRRIGSTFPMQNVTFRDNANSHLYLTTEQIRFIDTESDFNGGYAEIYGGATERTGSENWVALNNGMYFLSGNVLIERQVTIAPGAVFESGTDVKISVQRSEGAIVAVGTADKPIIFTGKSKAKGAWAGINISTNSVENHMEHVEISYGGGKDLDVYMGSGNLGVYNNAKLRLNNAKIAKSAKHGILVRESRDASLAFSNVTYEDNTGENLFIY